MNWLKDSVYLAAWLALPTTVVIGWVQSRASKPMEQQTASIWPIKKVLVYLLFLICFPLTLTPWAEPASRLICGIASIPLFLFIVLASDKDWSE